MGVCDGVDLAGCEGHLIEDIAGGVVVEAALGIEETGSQPCKEGGVRAVGIALGVEAGCCYCLDHGKGTVEQSVSQQQS